MLKAFSTPHNRKRSFVLFAICGVLAVAAAIVGISDNPPGLLLAFLSASTFIVSFVHPWRVSKHFRRLVYASLLGFIVSVVLHNVFDAIGGHLTGSGFLQGLINGAGVAFFFIAIFICPPGLVIGAIGALVMFIKNRRGSPPSAA